MRTIDRSSDYAALRGIFLAVSSQHVDQALAAGLDHGHHTASRLVEQAQELRHRHGDHSEKLGAERFERRQFRDRLELLAVDDSLVDMYQYLKNNQKIGIIGPKFLNLDKSPQASVFPPQTALNAFKEFFLGQKTYSKYYPKSQKPLAVHSLSGGAMLLSKKLFNQIGGWDQRYFMYFEDLELCRQVRHLGLEIFYFPQCRFIHRHGASGHQVADSANQWRRLIPGSKLYHGTFNHYLINGIIWLSQKLK